VDEIRQEFEAYVDELRPRLRAASATGADGERARESSEEVIREYRAKLRVEQHPSRGRELLERFKEDIRRL
jgi:hypothetical protein